MQFGLRLKKFLASRLFLLMKIDSIKIINMNCEKVYFLGMIISNKLSINYNYLCMRRIEN